MKGQPGIRGTARCSKVPKGKLQAHKEAAMCEDAARRKGVNCKRRKSGTMHRCACQALKGAARRADVIGKRKTEGEDAT
eukprot:1158453-Pelagomonas_calceolata.AAC.6